MSFGIALPSWIVKKENSVWVLGLYALVFMVALPIVVSKNTYIIYIHQEHLDFLFYIHIFAIYFLFRLVPGGTAVLDFQATKSC